MILRKIDEMLPGNISRKELKRKMDRNEDFALVDARSFKSYSEEHIRGAISLPLDEVEEKAEQILSKNDEIIVYCGSFSCPRSANEVKRLRNMGFKNVKRYAGGIKDWKKAGYQTEKG